jgi:hypothetical protein
MVDVASPFTMIFGRDVHNAIKTRDSNNEVVNTRQASGILFRKTHKIGFYWYKNFFQ